MTQADPSFDHRIGNCIDLQAPSSLLTPEIAAKLDNLAKARNQTADVTLSQLLDAEMRRLGCSDPSCLALTAKQQQVIQKLRGGLSVKEVAAAMNLSEQTVRTHILRARTRLGHSDLLSLRFL